MVAIMILFLFLFCNRKVSGFRSSLLEHTAHYED